MLLSHADKRNCHIPAIILSNNHRTSNIIIALQLPATLVLTDDLITTYATPALLSGLMMYMAFIVYRLGADSKAGKMGMFVLFLGLMVGVLGFALKYVIKYFIEGSVG